MKTKFTRISSILLAVMLLVAMVPVQAIALDNGGAGGSEAGELQWICVSGAHSYEGVVTKAATCTETGVLTKTCTVCGQTKTENIPATGHTLTATAAVAETCTTAGNTAYWTCSECGKYFSDENGENEIEADSWIVPATGTHTWNEGVVTKAATCTETGVLTKTCTVCGATTTEDIPMIAHTAVADPAVAATCTTTGLTAGLHCSVCGAVIEAQEVVPATEHTFDNNGELHEAVAASCTEVGYPAYYYCTVCHQFFDEDGELIEGATSLEDLAIPATGHTVVEDAAVAPTCTETGLTAGSHCSVCNAVIVAQEVVPATGHTVVNDAAVAATCTETGLTAGSHCSVCNAVIVAQETVPAAGHTWVAWQEGDDIADFTLKAAATSTTPAVYYKNCSIDGTSAQGIDEDATFTYGDPLPDTPDILYGDANGDKDINGADAVLLSRYIAEIIEREALATGADVNGDGDINGADAVLLSRYIAEIVTIDALGPQS